ncbi:hypothetical protein ACH3XW_4090 [Acanthocheilonema viteae]
MIPIQVIYYIAFPTVFLSISGAETTKNTKNVHTDFIIIGYSWQYATNDESLRKFVDQFGLLPRKNETQIFRIMTREMEKWKDLLESHIDVYVELTPWLQEQTVINIYKTCDEMNLAEFTLLHDIVNTTRNSILIIDSDSKSSDRINILMRFASKCNLCAQSIGKVSSTIYFCNNAVNSNWINKIGRPCHAAISSVPNGLKRENTIYSLIPRIFASATEHKYHGCFYHSTQQSHVACKTYQDSQSHYVLNRHRRKHHIYAKKYKLLKLHREQEAKRKIRKETSDILEVPIGRRKLLCKYRKSCYKTGIIPDTWNIHNVLPRFMNLYGQKEKETEMQKGNKNDEKEEISEAELKLLCRYRKSCYKEVGAEIEKSASKVQSGPIFSRVTTILAVTKQKSTKEIAKMALTEAEDKERIAALRPTPKKVIIDRDLNQIKEKMTKRLACKYRKSCYDSGVLPKIDTPFDNLFQKLYNFLRRRNQQTGIQDTHKDFNDLNDNEKRVYCKYRKSCYNTAQKPVINSSEIFKYMHIVKKFEEVIPLKIRCKYRKSCYDTGILPDLKKKVNKETQPVVPMQIVTSLYHFKTLCKYRKSCYKRKAEEQQNLNVELLDKIKTLDKDESEWKKENGKDQKIIKPFQKEAILKSEKAEESNTSKKMERDFETKTNNKKLTKKSKVFLPELEEKKIAATTGNEKFEKTVHKSKKKKTKDLSEETPVELAKKDQKTASSTTITKQSITEKKAPERVRPKKERLKAEKVQKDEKIIKEKKNLIKKKGSGKKPLSTATEEPLVVKIIQPVFSQAENITPLRDVNIYDKSLSPIAIKLLCKYRKSCYQDGKLLLIKTEKATLHNFQEKEDHRSLEIRCKYRKSCYETGKLPENLQGNLMTRHLTEEKKEYLPLTLRCKYRKSCYETGKLPPIEINPFGFSVIQIINEYKNRQSVKEKLSKEQLKLRCKYRKSCYESGKLPPYLNHMEYVVSTSVKQHENLQLKCKYRKSCYKSMELDIKLDRVRKKEEQKKMQEGIVKAPHQTKPETKHKEKDQKKKVQGEVANEENKRTPKKKSKESKFEAKEHEYMQIEPLDSQPRQIEIKLRLLNNTQKLKCKYRLKCYNGVPLHQAVEEEKIEKQRQLSIKDFRRANGAICNIYYISCRKKAGLPILERAPIGPNGRRLCRKKKKEELLIRYK